MKKLILLLLILMPISSQANDPQKFDGICFWLPENWTQEITSQKNLDHHSMRSEKGEKILNFFIKRKRGKMKVERIRYKLNKHLSKHLSFMAPIDWEKLRKSEVSRHIGCFNIYTLHYQRKHENGYLSSIDFFMFENGRKTYYGCIEEYHLLNKRKYQHIQEKIVTSFCPVKLSK